MGLTAEDGAVLALSLRVSLLAVVVLFPLALLSGHALARARGRWQWMGETLVSLPLVIPPVALGFLLLMMFRRQSPLGGWMHDFLGIRVALDFAGAVIAAMVVGFPLMAQAIRVGIASVDVKLEQAARTLGASRFRVWWTITWPLAWRGMVVGVLTAFARMLGEFGATIVLAGSIPGVTRTLPLAIFHRLVSGQDGAAWRLVGLSIAISALAMAAAQWFVRSREP